MTNKYIPIKQKVGRERNKEVWLVKDKEGNLISSFRQKKVALEYKSKLERERFEPLFLERDNSYRELLKEKLDEL